MPINYSTKVNRRPLGQEQQIVTEPHIIGVVGAVTATAQPYVVKLIEVPFLDTPSSVVVTGIGGFPVYTEVTGSPQLLEYVVDYAHGYLTFHHAQQGNAVQVTYKGRGSEVDAVDINEVQGPVGQVINPDGSIQLHNAAVGAPDGTLRHTGSDVEAKVLGNWKSLTTGGEWGDLTGTISNQTDLQLELDAKQDVLPAATSVTDGYLTSTDWSTFNAKQDALGFTPEDVSNKSIDGTLASNSDTLYPTEKAVKTYVDNNSSISPLTTKGDIFTHSTVDTRLGVGIDGQMLVADSAEPTGLKWVSVGGSGEVNTASNLGAGTGVFAQKTGPDLEFKSLTVQERLDTDTTLPVISSTSTTVVIPVEKFHTWIGTQAEYDAIAVKDNNTTYFVNP